MPALLNIAAANCIAYGDTDRIDAWLFYETMRAAETLEPFNKMRLAVFQDALEELTSQDRNERRHARNYITANQSDWPCSFVAVCEDILKINPDAVRRIVLQPGFDLKVQGRHLRVQRGKIRGRVD